MYMSRFGVKNYKCLGDIDIPLTPIHVLIGENDAGKTSLLEAMEAFCASSEKPLAEVFPGPWNGRELVRHAAPAPQVELYGAWERHENERRRYRFKVDFPPRGNGCSVYDEWIQIGGLVGSLAITDSSPERTVLSAVRNGIPIRPNSKLRVGEAVIGEHGEAEKVCMRLCNSHDSLKPACRYAFEAKKMASPATINPERKFRLEPDGFGLPTLLGDILEHDAERFLQLSKEFCGYFPQFSRVRLETGRDFGDIGPVGPIGAVGPAPLRRAIYLESRGGQSVRAQQVSDGAILFLGFLALAYLPDPPNLLLIEEPENGIYPKRLKEVLKLLKQLVTRTEGVPFPQIIMTTHSPYVLSHFDPEEVTFLSRPPGEPDGPVRARPLRDAPNIRERLGDDFYLGELWYNLSEEDLFGEP